ncbi:MFS transporter [Paenibacillus ginsengarvi]|uniref:MFS transporter n=1 Tax=Paenibacillus ginsengarvi TaxID=400777 RepID=A0A3B0CK67_9BACL|nr:MFS transporter [Paenibacillus ginsengarvi]RKN85221.1 MFS transporter [Paenibacillus ginsengarvi]
MNTSIAVQRSAQRTSTMLLGVSFAHLLNDAMQAAVPAGFPIFQQSMNLSFAQVGWVAFTLNITASILQPLIGRYTDRRPLPILLPMGMLFTLIGVIGLALASSFFLLLSSVALIGVGSSILHPESSRVAHLSAGKSKGLAQSIFQIGGNTGQALAPLLIAFFIVPQGQGGFLWFAILAIIGIGVQWYISKWYGQQVASRESKSRASAGAQRRFSNRYIAFVFTVLIILLFSKFVYLASMTGYYAFYAMERFHLSLEQAQICMFALQFAGMVGTLIGGPLADRIGRKTVIWFSIFGTAPFSLLLPYASPAWAIVLCLCIGLILMSGFSVIIVYAQEMMPGNVGTVAGLFFGLSFGLGGIGSVVLGWAADVISISSMMHICSWLPLLGVVAFLLPKDRKLVATA